MNSNAGQAAVNASGAVTSLFGGMAQSQALRTQGEIADRAGRLNAEFAELQAEDAITRSNWAIGRQSREAGRVLGSQRARLAAQGISIDSGSALDAQIETGRLSQEDAVMIRSNAFREALGFKSQASNYRSAAQLAKMSGDLQANQTLLTGGVNALQSGLKAAGNYADFKKDALPPKTSPESGYGYSSKRVGLRRGTDSQGWGKY